MPLPTTVDLCHLCHEIEKDFSLVVEALEGLSNGAVKLRHAPKI